MSSAGRILVGLDFSEGSARALSEAKVLGLKLGLEVTVLHVAEGFPASGARDGGSRPSLAPEQVDGEPVAVRHGYPWVELVRYAHEIMPAMIVVGSHGSSGFQPLSLGSTAARLAVLSPFPVLVVTSSARATVRRGSAIRPAGRSYP